MKKYRTIYADPPWKYGKWGGCSGRGSRGLVLNGEDTPMPYDTMTIEEIKALPIIEIADDNCELYLWTTQRYLPISFEIIKHWGFKYCQTLTWCKEPRGTGQGGIYTPTTEFLILARRGKMPKVERVNTTWWKVKRPHNNHSKKPDSFRTLIESVTEEPRIELFARNYTDTLFSRWDVWGNEVESDIQLDLAI